MQIKLDFGYSREQLEVLQNYFNKFGARMFKLQVPFLEEPGEHFEEVPKEFYKLLDQCFGKGIELEYVCKELKRKSLEW